MKIILGISMALVLLTWAGARIGNSILYDRACGGHLKRAADANTVELATREMEIAVTYLERNGMTRGYTSVFYNTPDEDVGFWYSNLKSSLEELKAVKADATQLEKSNVLMKLRETLLDSGQSTSVTSPDGISIFPNNLVFFWWGLLSLIITCICFGIPLFEIVVDV